jgi:hypothetical protein
MVPADALTGIVFAIFELWNVQRVLQLASGASDRASSRASLTMLEVLWAWDTGVSLQVRAAPCAVLQRVLSLRRLASPSTW